jgi:serine/threonine-protein kinase
MNNQIRPVNKFSAPHLQVFDDAELSDRRDATAILSERFTILKAVGVDHHLIRLLAREPGQDDLFLLEVLVDSAACDAELTELFYLEAEAAARLDHPNITAAHRAERLDNIHYRIIAHHPHSETLRELLDRAGWLSAARVAEIAAQLAQALAHAHERGVLHLRLQAEDVLLDRENNALLGNFGIADRPELKWAHLHRLGQLRLSSLCPEAADTDEARAADWYALGALCYEMLTDRVPFDSEDAEYLRRKQSLSRPLYPHIITPGIPEGLARLVV